MSKALLGRRMRAIHVPPRVVIDNHASNTYTVLEVNGRDRPGLLHDVTAAISEQGLQIASAHVSTYGVRAVDVFYVKDVFGLKVENERKLAAVARGAAGGAGQSGRSARAGAGAAEAAAGDGRGLTGGAAMKMQPHDARARPDAAAQIVAEAAVLLGGDEARAALWFRHHPLAGFGGATAEGLAAAGHADAVLAYLRMLRHRVFG